MEVSSTVFIYIKEMHHVNRKYILKFYNEKNGGTFHVLLFNALAA